MPNPLIPVLVAGDCRVWETDAHQWVCVAVAEQSPVTVLDWTLDPVVLGNAFGAGLVLMGPIVAALIAGYSILRALRNRRG